MDAPIQSLLERLQTGWQPARDEIDMRILQQDIHTWIFVGGGIVGLFDGGSFQEHVAGEVLWIDSKQRWALCADVVFWLNEDEPGATNLYVKGG
jgi:hypothetical protein